MIREYLKEHILITDGAMGTYYSQITGKNAAFSELANEIEPDIVKDIHLSYIHSGAKLIRTNTFAANTRVLNSSKKDVKKILEKGYEIALEAAYGHDVFVAADMGPIPDVAVGETEVYTQDVLKEYRFIADAFMEMGADVFILETLSSTDYLRIVADYIKNKNPSAFILVQFATTIEGYTRKGIGIPRIVKDVKSMPSIDAYGFNCGAGPTHLYQFLKTMDFTGDIVSVMPNAGYPEIVHERTIYRENPEYFSDVMMDIAKLGIKIIGGCCGTTPMHISKMREKLGAYTGQVHQARVIPAPKIRHIAASQNLFYKKLIHNEFPVAVELDPPFDMRVEKVLEGARLLKENGVDIITVADSPLARPRINSMMLAAKIKREVGIDTMPHVCCRDQNIISLKSMILAGYMEEIRNVLAVTGDPIPGGKKSSIKSVFNLNSQNLMALIHEMNNELFSNDPYRIGGALNLNALNKDAEILRMEQKMEKGAQFFLTQPIFASDVVEYLAALKERRGAKILGGVMPLVSYRNAQFLNNEVPGIHIPQSFIDSFHQDMDRQEAEEIGIEIAVGIINKIKRCVQGLYLITPFYRVNMIIKILRQVL
jgi:methionine synthase I (cobalamin-dependent)/5,10-methylenetetrahydrofolate reductase